MGNEGRQPLERSCTRLTLCLLQAYFRPELLNRLDEIVVFKQLSMADTGAIAALLMQETRERIAQRGIGLEVTPALMRFICQEGHSEVRALRHAAACCGLRAHRREAFGLPQQGALSLSLVAFRPEGCLTPSQWHLFGTATESLRGWMSLLSPSAGCLIARSCVSLLRSLTLDCLQNSGGSIPLLTKALKRQYRASKPRCPQVTTILAPPKLERLLHHLCRNMEHGP